MSKQSQAAGGGTSALTLLGVAFVVLKLCGVIDWSWWWVTAPFWGLLAVAAAIVAIIAMAVCCVWIWEKVGR